MAKNLNQHQQALKDNREVITKMLQEYEEAKSTPNCNPISIIANNYFIMEFKISDDEHANTLGI
jgi:hypothetical protein